MGVFEITDAQGRVFEIDAPDQNAAMSAWQKYSSQQDRQAGPSTSYVDSAGQAVPPSEIKPGTREYADWAAANAQAGNALPQVSAPPPENQSSVLDPLVQGITFGWGDELRGLAQGGMAAAQGGDFGAAYDQTVDESRNALARERRVNPIGSIAAEFAGAIPTGVGLGGQVVGRGATLGARALSGLGVAGAQGAAYGAGSEDENKLLGAAIGGALGGGLGLAAPYIGAGARRLVSPSPSSPTQRQAARTMADEGVTLSAGQKTGDKGLQYLESELGKGAADNLMERQAEEFTGAVLRRLGVNANRATPEVVEGAYRQIGAQFDNLAQLTNTPFDSTLQNNLINVASDYVANSGSPAPVVENMVNRIGELAQQNGGRLTGRAYQEMRSRIGKFAASASDPTTKMALRELQDALDDAVERNLSGQTLQAWRDARRAYQNYLVVERAVTSAGEKAASGLITPAQLRAASVNQNRRAFAFGSNDYANLARAGIQTMTPLPQSGTNPRQQAQILNSLPAILGAAVGSPAGLPGAIVGGMAGAAIPRVVGGALLSRPGRAFMSNQFAAGPEAGIVERSIRSAAPVASGKTVENVPLRLVVNGAGSYR